MHVSHRDFMDIDHHLSWLWQLLLFVVVVVVFSFVVVVLKMFVPADMQVDSVLV